MLRFLLAVAACSAVALVPSDRDTAAAAPPAGAPKVATWCKLERAEADSLLASTRQAWAVAAEYSGLPLEQVHFVGAMGTVHGAVYQFVYPPHAGFVDTCDVDGLTMCVFRAPLRQPWRAPELADLKTPLSRRDARRIGEAFIRDYLKLPLATVRPVDAPHDPQADQAYWRLAWKRLNGDVEVPGGVSATIDGDTGEVLEFSRSDIPLTVSLTPRVTREQAVAAARRAIAQKASHGSVTERGATPEELAALATAEPAEVTAEVSEIFDPKAAGRVSGQRLFWRVTFPPTGVWGASVDAESGEVSAGYRAPHDESLTPWHGRPGSAEGGFRSDDEFARLGKPWGTGNVPRIPGVLTALLADGWRPPAEARAICSGGRNEGQARAGLSYSVHGAQVCADADTSDGAGTRVALRFTGHWGQPPFGWNRETPDRDILRSFAALVIAPERAESSLQSRPGPPWPVAHRLRFSRSEQTQATADGTPIALYMGSANGCMLSAWVLRGDRPEVHLTAIR